MTDQTVNIPTSEVLYRAADLIEERGWTQGRDGWPRVNDADSPLCLEGGILAAIGSHVDNRAERLWGCPAYQAVADYLSLPRQGGSNRRAVWLWNDKVDADFEYVRTATEVIEVLRAAAVIEASRERETAEAVTR